MTRKQRLIAIQQRRFRATERMVKVRKHLRKLQEELDAIQQLLYNLIVEETDA